MLLYKVSGKTFSSTTRRSCPVISFGLSCLWYVQRRAIQTLILHGGRSEWSCETGVKSIGIISWSGYDWNLRIVSIETWENRKSISHINLKNNPNETALASVNYNIWWEEKDLIIVEILKQITKKIKQIPESLKSKYADEEIS